MSTPAGLAAAALPETYGPVRLLPAGSCPRMNPRKAVANPRPEAMHVRGDFVVSRIDTLHVLQFELTSVQMAPVSCRFSVTNRPVRMFPVPALRDWLYPV